MTHSVPVSSPALDFEAVVRQMLLAEPAPAQIPPHCFRPVTSRTLPKTPADMLELLLEKVRASMIAPALRSATRERYMQIVGSQWREFLETSEAMRVILQSTAPFAMEADAAEFVRILTEAARSLAGDIAAEEVEFDLATCERAFAVAEKLPNSMSSSEEGRRVLREFRTHIFLHGFGSLAILSANQEPRLTQAGITTSFELLRGGALHAYAIARSAQIELSDNDQASESFEELPFDDEDMRLVAAG